MSVVAATDAEEPHHILNDAAVAESNGNALDMETDPKHLVPTNVKDDQSLGYGAEDASNASQGNVDETESFVEVSNASAPTILETEPSTNGTNIPSTEHTTAEVAFAPQEPKIEDVAVNALETTSAPPSSTAVPILDDEDASTVPHEIQLSINDPILGAVEVMQVEEKTPEGLLPSNLTDVPVLDSKDTVEAQSFINDVVPTATEDIAPADAAELASVEAAVEDTLDDDEAILAGGSFIPESAGSLVVEIPSLKEEAIVRLSFIKWCTSNGNSGCTRIIGCSSI
ncbi:hypothetical protein C8R45DRAFT_343675 [Mycena sanguinolenta]|nr:hypothetical protein C8R45DRAFT_343675 [Mycena sanguinolenta]